MTSLAPWPMVADAFGRFSTWWLGELQSFVPQPVLRALRNRTPELLITACDGRRGVALKRSGDLVSFLDDEALPLEPSEKLLDSISKRVGAVTPVVTAVVEPTQCLRPTITLPLATGNNLSEAIRYQIGVISPFRSDEVLFEAAEKSRNAAEKTITVNVMIIPKAALAPLENFATSLGRAIDRVAVADSASLAKGELLYLRTYPRVDGSRGARLLDALLVAVLLISVSAHIALPFWQLQRATREVRSQIAALRPVAQAASATRREVQALQQIGAEISTARTTALPALALLERLAGLLPDDTFLSELRAEGSNVSLTGFAGETAKLVSVLEVADEFAEAKLTSAISREQSSGRERFTLTFVRTRSP